MLDSIGMSHDTSSVASSYERYLSRGLGRLGRLMGDHVESVMHGCYLTLDDGSRYLNCGGYGTFFVGAVHPHVVDSVIRQIRRRPLSTKALLDPVLVEAAEKLLSKAPDGMERVYFSPSGTDAVEVAKKLCLNAGCTRTISFMNGFHGKTFGSLGLTDNAKYKNLFCSGIVESIKVPWGDTNALDAALRDDGGRCALFIEPVQSEAGVLLPPPGFLDEVSRLVTQYGAVLVADEIMTGLGRCGRWWQSSSMRPDIVLAGKALSGGVIPVAATMANSQLFSLLDDDPFVHTSTFGCTPLQAAAVVAVLEVIDGEGLVERSNAVGQHVLTQINDACRQSSIVSEVRGAGLLIGVECADSGLAGELFSELIDRRIVANHSLNGSRVVRFTPPAILDDEGLAWLVEGFDDSLRAISQRLAG